MLLAGFPPIFPFKPLNVESMHKNKKKHQKHLLNPFQKGLKAKGDLFLFSVASRDKGYISPFTKLKIKNLVDFLSELNFVFFWKSLCWQNKKNFSG